MKSPTPQEQNLDLTLLADVNGNKLYRVGEKGCFWGDFWFDADGEVGYIDTGYLIEGGEYGNEAQLIQDFTKDYQ